MHLQRVRYMLSNPHSGVVHGFRFEVGPPTRVLGVAVELLGLPRDIVVARESQREDSETWLVRWPRERVQPGHVLGLVLRYVAGCAPSSPRNLEWIQTKDLIGDFETQPDQSIAWNVREISAVSRFRASPTSSKEAADRLSALRELEDASHPERHLDATYVRSVLPIAYFADGDPETVARRLFFFDVELNLVAREVELAGLTDSERVARSAVIRSKIVELSAAILRRIDGEPSGYSASVSASWFGAQHVSSLLIKLISTHFAGSATARHNIQWTTVGRTFAEFAARRLYTRHGFAGLNCQPDGDNFLMFFEFAFQCYAYRIEPEFWLEFLRACLPSILVFFPTYEMGRVPSWPGYPQTGVTKIGELGADEYREYRDADWAWCKYGFKALEREFEVQLRKRYTRSPGVRPTT